jgi:glycosyltransferase involved in cell wall biosynthesis
MVPDVGVLALVPERWDATWQVRHQVLSRLAGYFPVVWMNPASEWRDIARHPGRFRAAAAETVSPGLTVYTPEPWRPLLYRPAWAARTLRRGRLLRGRRLLQERGCRRVVLYLWRPELAEDREVASADLTCYHIDDEFSFSPVEQPLDPVEQRLIASADRVFIHSPALLEKKGRINPRTRVVPNGVDYRAYAAPADEPADLRRIPHPRIGYTGTLKLQLDWPLLRALAGRHPEWSFVFVGPRKAHPAIAPLLDEMAARPNVHFLGSKPVGELAAYAQHVDVCIMPYAVNDYTKYIYPLKLHEYLATGRPVVGTRIRTLEAFAGVLGLASGVEGWSGALADALGPEAADPARCAARQAVAQAHDWDTLVRGIATTLAGDLGVVLPREGAPRRPRADARMPAAAAGAAGRAAW